MDYKRPTARKKVFVPFETGKHRAKIVDVALYVSDKGNKSFKIRLTGSLNQQVTYYLGFGNDMTAQNLTFLLASIEDNGVVIPELDFGYNRATVNFLHGKYVYINVVAGKYKGKKQMKVGQFLTKDEFEEGLVDGEAIAENEQVFGDTTDELKY